MRISNYKLNVDRVDIAQWYELKMKSEERRSVSLMILILLAPFALSLLITNGIVDFIGAKPEDTWLLEIATIESLIILVLSILTTTNYYASGKLYRRLRKNGNIADMLRTLRDTGEDSAFMHISYILYFNQYIKAEVVDNRELVIVYMEDGVQKYYRTYDFKVECSADASDATLLIDPCGVHIVGGSIWPSLNEVGGYA